MFLKAKMPSINKYVIEFSEFFEMIDAYNLVFNIYTLLANIYLFKVNNGKNRKRCEICSHVLNAVLVLLLLTSNIFHTFF